MHRRNPMLVYFCLFSLSLALISSLVWFQFSRGSDLPLRSQNDQRGWFRPVSTDPDEKFANVEVTDGRSPDESECLEIIEDTTSNRDFEVVIWKPENPEEEAEQLRQAQLADERKDALEQDRQKFLQNGPQQLEQQFAEVLKRHQEFFAEHEQAIALNNELWGSSKVLSLMEDIQSDDPFDSDDFKNFLHPHNDPMMDPGVQLLRQHQKTMQKHREEMQKQRERFQQRVEQARARHRVPRPNDHRPNDHRPNAPLPNDHRPDAHPPQNEPAPADE